MEIIRFVFWEAVKVLALVILGLMSSKGVAALSLRKGWLKPVLYALILALAGVGAWEVGNDVAAEVYLWSCNGNLSHGELDKAYSNSLQAVHPAAQQLELLASAGADQDSFGTASVRSG